VKAKLLAWLLAGLLAALSACAPLPTEAPQEMVGCEVVPVTELAVKRQRNEPQITARLNNQPVMLVFDTGAQGTLIGAEVASRLQLPQTPHPTGTMHAVGGKAPAWEARTRDIQLGEVTLRDRTIRVAPVRFPRPEGRIPDGLLGADILSRYDIDLDIPSRRVVLHLPRQCQEGGPGWSSPHIALPMLPSPPGRILVPVELDGVRVGAVVDTGAEFTTISRDLALHTGVTEAALNADPAVTIVGAADAETAGRWHRFGAIRIGPLLARQPVLLVASLPPQAGGAVLGMDFLGERRIWISYASRRVFVGIEVRALAGR